MLTEVGEVGSLLEKHAYYGQPLDKLRLLDELGDVGWYFSQACNALGLNIEDVLEANQRKLKARFPDRYNDNAAMTRDLQAEDAALRGDSLKPLEDAELGRRFLEVEGRDKERE